jgi:hypothetical protein
MCTRSFSDHLHHAFQFAKHLIIRKSKNRIAFPLDPRVPLLIALPTRFKIVTFAIKFDDQAGGVADEISDIVSEGNLPPKTETLDPMRLDVAP